MLGWTVTQYAGILLNGELGPTHAHRENDMGTCKWPTTTQAERPGTDSLLIALTRNQPC